MESKMRCPKSSDALNLSPELQARAKKDVNEDLATRAEAVERLRKLVQDVKGLHSRTDDEFLVRFLRAGLYDIDAALKNIKDYYTYRLNNPGMFLSSHPNEADAVLQRNWHALLPERDNNGSVIICFRVGSWNTRVANFDEFMKGMVVFMEHIQKYPDLQVNGFCCIVDMKGLGWQHIRELTPSRIKVCVGLIEECFPTRYSALHVINENFFFHILFAIAKQFMSMKILEVMRLHGSNMDTLHETVPPHVLPEEFGGTAGPMDNSEGRKLLYEDKEIANDIKYGFIKP